jgi:hypothetical protein
VSKTGLRTVEASGWLKNRTETTEDQDVFGEEILARKTFSIKRPVEIQIVQYEVFDQNHIHVDYKPP